MATPPDAEPREVAPAKPAREAVDPVHVVVLIVCALLLLGIALHYL